MSQAQILVVDDERDIRELVKEILEDEGYSVQAVPDGESARVAFKNLKPDLVLLDIWMPDIDGITLLKEWSAGGSPECPVVIMSGHGTLETAVEATRHGAFDFVQKPLSLAKLLATVSQALESKPKSGSTVTSESDKPTAAPLGNSPVMQTLRGNARKAATHTSPVLISGQPGSGREELARYIHQLSPSTGNMVMFDHNRVDDDARSYLFGDAGDDRVGRGLLEEAAGGCLFIPELQRLTKATLTLLDTLLESGRYFPTGGKQAKSIECRVICSAGENLERLVNDGKVPRGLYFRVNVLPLKVPSLLERPEDIPELIRYYSDWFPNQEGLAYRQFSVSVQNRLRNHGWPGNVRELRNLVRQLLVFGAEGEVSLKEVDEALGQDTSNMVTGHEVQFDLPLREARENFERDYLVYQLKKAGGSVGKLSESVGMEITHLYRKLRSLGIDPKSGLRRRSKN